MFKQLSKESHTHMMPLNIDTKAKRSNRQLTAFLKPFNIPVIIPHTRPRARRKYFQIEMSYNSEPQHFNRRVS